MGVGDCCHDCCYSTPYVTLGAVSMVLLGLGGFALSGIYGLAVMDGVPHLQNGTVLMAPVVASSVILTILPILVDTLLAYCITGYIRDILFRSVVKRCITPAYSICAIVLTSAFVLLWVLLSIGFAGILTYYVQAEIFCGGLEADASGTFNVRDCFFFVDTSFGGYEVCSGDGLEELCTDGLKVGLAFSIGLIFIIIIITGLVFLLVVLSANFISARDNFEYRSANPPQSSSYFSKQDR